MNITLIKPQQGMQYDITKLVSRAEWGGSASSAARELTIDYVNSLFDGFDIPRIATGDIVSFSPGSEEVFYGQFYGSTKSSEIGTISMTAFDPMKKLLESTASYNFKNQTPEAIAAMVCNDLGIPIRFLYPTGVVIASLLCDEMTPYDIIMAAYTKAHRITGDKYFPMFYKRGYAVYKTEWIVTGFSLASDENITAASIEESVDSIVNKVKIYDDKGNQIGEVADQESMTVFGTFQTVYKQEKDVDPVTAANNMLATQPIQTIQVSALGDINCLSCYFVTMKDYATGLAGKYWISSDRHVWENGAHTMELELTFDSIFTEVEGTEEKKEGE